MRRKAKNLIAIVLLTLFILAIYCVAVMRYNKAVEEARNAAHTGRIHGHVHSQHH